MGITRAYKEDKAVKKYRAEREVPVAILLDTKGPEIS